MLLDNSIDVKEVILRKRKKRKLQFDDNQNEISDSNYYKNDEEVTLKKRKTKKIAEIRSNYSLKHQ